MIQAKPFRGAPSNSLKGTHKPLIHPPLAPAATQGLFFVPYRFGTAGVRSFRNRTPCKGCKAACGTLGFLMFVNRAPITPPVTLHRAMSVKLARSAGLIGVATMASRVLGVAREMVLAAFFGARAASRWTRSTWRFAFRICSAICSPKGR